MVVRKINNLLDEICFQGLLVLCEIAFLTCFEMASLLFPRQKTWRMFLQHSAQFYELLNLPSRLESLNPYC